MKGYFKIKELHINQRYKLLKVGRARDKTLLDIGAGPLALIAAQKYNCKVTSIDISPYALDEARKDAIEKGVTQIKFEKADATNLPYKNNSFDIVVSFCVLHHIIKNKREIFITEAYRVAKEKIIIAELNPCGFKKIHSGDSYETVILNWLEKKLNSLKCKILKYCEEEMNIYICLKNNLVL